MGGSQGGWPLHAFFVRIRARRGHQIAAVAVARKLAVLCWHLLTKDEDYLSVGTPRAGRQQDPRHGTEKPASHRQRATGADQPMPTASRRCATRICRSPNRPSATTPISSRAGRRDLPPKGCASASNRQGKNRHLAALPAVTPRFATRSPRPSRLARPPCRASCCGAEPRPRQPCAGRQPDLPERGSP